MLPFIKQGRKTVLIQDLDHDLDRRYNMTGYVERDFIMIKKTETEQDTRQVTNTWTIVNMY